MRRDVELITGYEGCNNESGDTEVMDALEQTQSDAGDGLDTGDNTDNTDNAQIVSEVRIMSLVRG